LWLYLFTGDFSWRIVVCYDWAGTQVPIIHHPQDSMKAKLPASFRVIGRAIVDWWDSWFDLLGVVIVWLVAQVTIVLGPPATFGLYYVAYRLTNGESLGIRGLIEGGRKFFWQAWLWALLNLLVIITVAVNLNFYGQFEGDWRFFVQVLLIFLSGLWFISQFYTLPFVFELKEEKVLLALRNGIMTALAAPFFTLILFIVASLIAIVCTITVLPIFMGVPAIIPLLGVRAVNNRLEAFGVRAPEKTPKEIEREQSSRIRIPSSEDVAESEREIEK
jgi:uncharacterized membrane protein YesL